MYSPYSSPSRTARPPRPSRATRRLGHVRSQSSGPANRIYETRTDPYSSLRPYGLIENRSFSSAPTSASTLRSAAIAPSSRVLPRTSAQSHYSTSSGSSTYNSHAPVYSRPSETNLNYKALYEKEKAESERLRKEMEEMRKAQDAGSSVSAFRSISSRFRNGSAGSGGNSQPLTKSLSGASFDDVEKRSMERKISDLELQLKTMGQLRMENQRLKEENGALVRVISKMTTSSD